MPLPTPRNGVLNNPSHVEQKQGVTNNHEPFIIPQLGGGFKYVLFSPLLGEMIQYD